MIINGSERYQSSSSVNPRSLQAAGQATQSALTSALTTASQPHHSTPHIDSGQPSSTCQRHDISSASRLTMANERVQYLIDEHRWLTDRCREYVAATCAIDAKFDDLKSEVADIKAAIGRPQMPATASDMDRYRQTLPTAVEREQLMAIIEQQRAVIDKLKAKKSKKLKDVEEEPRVLDVGEHRDKKQVGLNADQLPDTLEVGDFRVPEEEPVEVRNFQTFGEIGKPTQLLEIKRRTYKMTENNRNPAPKESSKK